MSFVEFHLWSPQVEIDLSFTPFHFFSYQPNELHFYAWRISVGKMSRYECIVQCHLHCNLQVCHSCSCLSKYNLKIWHLCTECHGKNFTLHILICFCIYYIIIIYTKLYIYIILYCIYYIYYVQLREYNIQIDISKFNRN